MNDLMIFEEHEVEVFELNGEVLFNPYHVGECLELSGEAVRKAVSRMNEKQVIKVRNSDVTNSNIRKLNTIPHEWRRCANLSCLYLSNFEILFLPDIRQIVPMNFSSHFPHLWGIVIGLP